MIYLYKNSEHILKMTKTCLKTSKSFEQGVDLKKGLLPVQNLECFSGILMNLELVLEHVLKSSKVPARQRSILRRNCNMSMALCAACSILGVDERSEQQWNGLPGVFRSGEFFPHCDTWAMSSRPCRRLLCCSYANTLANTFPQIGFLHWYPIMHRYAW